MTFIDPFAPGDSPQHPANFTGLPAVPPRGQEQAAPPDTEATPLEKQAPADDLQAKLDALKAAGL